MRVIFCVVVFSVLLTLKSFSQDTILLVNNDSLFGTIIDNNADEIQYQKTNSDDRSVYIQKKSNIKALIFANGRKEVYEVKEKLKPRNPENQEKTKDTVKGSSYKIEDYHNRYLYKGKFNTEQEIQALMIQTNDKGLYKLVQKSQRAKMISRFGFVAVPLAIGVVYSKMMYAKTASEINASAQTDDFKQSQLNRYATFSNLYTIGAIGFSTLAIVAIINNHSNTRKAVKVFNQLY